MTDAKSKSELGSRDERSIVSLVPLLHARVVSVRCHSARAVNWIRPGRNNEAALQRVNETGTITGVIVAIAQVSFFRNAPMGFDQHAIVTMTLPGDSVSQTKWESFRHELLQAPGVEKVSLSSAPPAGRGNSFATFRYYSGWVWAG